mmetsp:Transcript_16122/g.13494  ORF Transcript_16122/g.13494 Transcript_16122/m.13494 type:complete len:99 (-) Transcript_16122:158-454(-)
MRCSKTWLPDVRDCEAIREEDSSSKPVGELAKVDDSAMELPQDIYIAMMTLGKEARVRAAHVPHQYRDILFIPRSSPPSPSVEISRGRRSSSRSTAAS